MIQRYSLFASDGVPGLDPDLNGELVRYDDVSALLRPVAATHRHKKRGSEYVLLGFGKMQAEHWVVQAPPRPGHAWADCTADMREVAIYRSVDDGSLWVRPREEFEDGRFEKL